MNMLGPTRIPTRLQLRDLALDLLRQRPRTLESLTALTKADQGRVLKTLRTLKEEGKVREIPRRWGRLARWEIVD